MTMPETHKALVHRYCELSNEERGVVMTRAAKEACVSGLI